MKKVMLVALIGLFTITMFAQNQGKAKPADKKKEAPKTEMTKPVQTTQTTQTAQPAKVSAQHGKHSRHSEKKVESTPKK